MSVVKKPDDLWQKYEELESRVRKLETPRGAASGTVVFQTNSTMLFSWGGQLQVGVGMSYRPAFNGTINSVRCNLTTTAGADVIVDVMKNGVSIYPTSAKPRVVAGSEYGSSAVPDTTTFVANDELQVEIEQTGSAADLVVAIDYRRTS